MSPQKTQISNNTFGGAQIVEVIVRDPARDETDEKQGEPTVKVDEHLLRMTQGADGYWYAYFGDKTAKSMQQILPTTT